MTDSPGDFTIDIATRQMLANYLDNPLQVECLPETLTLPLNDDACVGAWQQYLVNARQNGVFSELQQRLVQLNFPIEAGISSRSSYRQAVFKGEFSAMDGYPALELLAPEKLQLFIHPTPVGRVAVLVAFERHDFIALVRALLKRNEPAAIADSIGAFFIAGYNNWDRIRCYREKWQQENGVDNDLRWSQEFSRLKGNKELYQDRFILLSHNPYSDIPADQVGLSPRQWGEVSVRLRLEHECAHYLTRRLFNSMRKNIWDELLADYRGITAVSPNYRADWFLLFLGLEDAGSCRPGGRFEQYLPDNLSRQGRHGLMELTRRSAFHLQELDAAWRKGRFDSLDPVLFFLSLCLVGLEHLAADEYVQTFQQSVAVLSQRLVMAHNSLV